MGNPGLLDDELPTADDEGIWYRWRCPFCNLINEDENDTRGQRVECEGCGEESRHAS